MDGSIDLKNEVNFLSYLHLVRLNKNKLENINIEIQS